MRILVTGGAGFIGSNLCERLILQGHDVLCLDNLNTGVKDNIQHLLNNDNFHFILHDVRETYDFKVDQIYNLACPASPVHYQKDPLYTLDTCYLGAKNALNLAKEYGATVLQASTSEVYGDPFVHPQTEEYWGNVNPIGIRSCYDEGKRISETLFFDYYRKYQTNVKIARIFNTYGVNMRVDDGRVVSNFIIQALNNEKITVYGDGKQTRSFCYIEDLVDGLIKLMNSKNGITGPINIGNPIEITMLDLAVKVLSFTGSQSSISFKPLPSDDPTRRKPDISQAKELLNWEPKIDFEVGLKRTIDYFLKKVEIKC